MAAGVEAVPEVLALMAALVAALGGEQVIWVAQALLAKVITAETQLAVVLATAMAVAVVVALVRLVPQTLVQTVPQAAKA